MKFKAGETHYKTKRLHLYLYVRSRAVQGLPPFAPRAQWCARAAHSPGAQLRGQQRREKQVCTPASQAPSNGAFPLSLRAV